MSEMMAKGFTVHGPYKADNRHMSIPAWLHAKPKNKLFSRLYRALEELPFSSNFQDSSHRPTIPWISLTFPIPIWAPNCVEPPQLWKFAGALFPPLLRLAIWIDCVTSPSKPLLKHLSSILCSVTTSLHDLFGAPYSISLSTTPGHLPFPYCTIFCCPVNSSTSKIQTAGCYAPEDSNLHSHHQMNLAS
jgi:hypothetical protein